MHDTQRVLYYQVVSVIGQLNCNGGCLLEQNLSFVGGIFPKTLDDSLDSDSHLNMSTQVQHHPCYLRFVQMSSFFSMQLCLVIGKQWDVTQKYFLIKQKYLPTIIRTLVYVAVWNRGASPETSHLNLPLVVRSTLRRTILVSVDLYSCQ